RVLLDRAEELVAVVLGQLALEAEAAVRDGALEEAHECPPVRGGGVAQAPAEGQRRRWKGRFGGLSPVAPLASGSRRSPSWTSARCPTGTRMVRRLCGRRVQESRGRGRTATAAGKASDPQRSEERERTQALSPALESG